MKKALSLLLSLVMVLSLAACSENQPPKDADESTSGSSLSDTVPSSDESEPNTAPKETQGAEDSAPADDMTYPERYEFWGIKPVKLPSIPALTWEDRPVASGSVPIATTPFDYDTEQVYQNLKNNAYLQTIYQELVISRSEMDSGQLFTDAGVQMCYNQTVAFCANLKDSYDRKLKYTQDFRAAYTHNSADYANIDGVYLTFNDLEADAVDQAAIYEIAAIVFGEEYAQILVFGSDSDGKNYDNGKSLRDADLSELVQSGNSSYQLSREIRLDDTITISFTLAVANNPKTNKHAFCYYGLDDTSLYTEMKYSFADIVPASFGGTDPLNFPTFADSFFKQFYPNYDRSSLDMLNLKIHESESGRKSYDYWMEVTAICSDATWDVNNLGLEFYVEEDAAGQIVALEVEGSSEIFRFSGNEKKTGQAYVDAVLPMISAIWPDMDLSGIAYVESEPYVTKDISLQLLGQTLTGELRFSFDDGYNFTLKM